MKRKAFIAMIVVLAIAVALYLADSLATRVAEKSALALVSQLQLSDKLEWHGISYNLFTQKLSINKIKINTAKPMLFEKIVLSDYKSTPFPAFSLDVYGINIPMTDKWLGMDILGNARLSFDSDTICVENAKLNNIGVIQAEFVFDDEINFRNLLSENVHGWLQLEDNGLAEHIISMLAQDLSSSKETAKGRLLTGINNRLRVQSGANYAQMYRYFDAPSKITIRTIGVPISLKGFLPPEDITGWRKMGDWAAELPVTVEYK